MNNDTATGRRGQPAYKGALGRALVDAAAQTARSHHEGQLDRAGAPYVKHLERVAAAVADESATTRAAAWLHDAVEDTLLTRQEISDQLGEKVATTVETVTRKERKSAYARYVDQIIKSGDRGAMLIEIADLVDHAMVSTEMLTPGMARRYLAGLDRLMETVARRDDEATDPAWLTARAVLEEIAGLENEPGPKTKAAPPNEMRKGAPAAV